MKKQILIIMLLMFNTMFVFIPTDIVVAGEPSGGNIDGDTIWWENNYARLEVYPHTSTNISVHKQRANLTWRESDDTIDVAFRFDSELLSGKIWRWNGDSWVQVSMSHTTYNGKHYYYYSGFNVVQDTTYYFKWEYQPQQEEGKWWLFAKLSEHSIQQAIDNNWYVALDPWWQSEWAFRRTVTINSANIDATLTDFPILLNVSAATSAKCQSTGADIRILGADNDTILYHTLGETWNTSSYNFVWVKVPSLSSSVNTVLNFYYGNPSCADTSNKAQVWSNGYKAVYYCNETSGETIYDYSGTGYTGTYAGGSASGITTRVGTAQATGGSYIVLDTQASPANDDGGILMNVFHPEGGVGDEFYYYNIYMIDPTRYIFMKHETAGSHTLQSKAYANPLVSWDTSSAFTTNPQTDWCVIYNMWDGSPKQEKSSFHTELPYVNARPTGHPPNKFRINSDWGGSSTWTGYVDEIRIYNTYKSQAWMDLEVDSMNQAASLITFSSEEEGAYFVYTNATTNHTAINATLHGYIKNTALLNGNYEAGFWMGNVSALTESSKGWNFSEGLFQKNSNYSYNTAVNSTLTQGERYYYRAWISNATTFSMGNVTSFGTVPDNVTGLVLTAVDYSASFTWTKGGGVNASTVIRRKSGSYPTDHDDGTIVYNGTSSSYIDVDIAGTYYYYRLWSYINPFSIGYVEGAIFIPPQPPTSLTTNVLGNNTFDIAWTKGIGANNTIIRRKLGSYPTDITDGTQIFNNTGSKHNIQTFEDNWFYSLWSYANLTYSTSANLSVGGLIVNCYDEETNESLEFDIEISNQDGSETYQSRNNTNSLILNVSQLPLGDQIKIIVSAAQNFTDKNESFTGYPFDENYTITYVVLDYVPESKPTTNVTCINVSSGAKSYPAFTLVDDLITILPDAADEFTKITVTYEYSEYGSRTYYRDLTASSFYLLDTYLPPAIDKEIYLLEVIDEASNTVQDAFIEIKRNVNGTYVIVSSVYTDANGQADVELIPEKNYIFIISKDDYVTENASWKPTGLIFTHTFKIFWEATPFEPDTFGDIIDFYGTLYTNNTMEITFYDLDNSMIDSHFIVYEDYNGTLTYMGEYNGTTSNDIVFWIDVDNATKLHVIVLYMNHTTLGQVINHRIVVYPVHIDRDDGTWLENLIQSVVGDFDYGYVITMMWVFPCILLIAGMASIDHPGIGILGAGLYSMWFTWNITLSEEAKILTFASIAIVVGFITLFLVKGKKVIH